MDTETKREIETLRTLMLEAVFGLALVTDHLISHLSQHGVKMDVAGLAAEMQRTLLATPTDRRSHLAFVTLDLVARFLAREKGPADPWPSVH